MKGRSCEWAIGDAWARALWKVAVAVVVERVELTMDAARPSAILVDVEAAGGNLDVYVNVVEDC